MGKSQIDKLRNYLLLFLSITFIIGAPMLYLEKADNKRQYERFLNQFYYELDGTLSQVDYVLSSYESENFDLLYNLAVLDKRMESTHLTLEAGSNFVNSDIRTQTYFFVNRIKIPRINEESRLEDNELKKIKEALEYMIDGLHSEETGQEDKNISIQEFNEILREGARIGE